MDDNEIETLRLQVKKLQEQQQKYLTFTTVQFVELFALLATVSDLQVMALTRGLGEFPELAAQRQKMLDAHRMRYQKELRNQIDLVGFVADKPQGPVV